MHVTINTMGRMGRPCDPGSNRQRVRTVCREFLAKERSLPSISQLRAALPDVGCSSLNQGRLELARELGIAGARGPVVVDLARVED